MEKEDVLKQYREKQDEIKDRIDEFRSLQNASEERIFQELVFVIPPSQTGAEKAWKAVQQLEKQGLLLEGSRDRRNLSQAVKNFSTGTC
ncbi:MAG: hypothetical protein ABEJ93_00260 [Candidatus Nanohalobium sp.]